MISVPDIENIPDVSALPSDFTIENDIEVVQVPKFFVHPLIDPKIV